MARLQDPGRMKTVTMKHHVYRLGNVDLRSFYVWGYLGIFYISRPSPRKGI